MFKYLDIALWIWLVLFVLALLVLFVPPAVTKGQAYKEYFPQCALFCRQAGYDYAEVRTSSDLLFKTFTGCTCSDRRSFNAAIVLGAEIPEKE